eukprot:751554-Hanusia_phi.AAC.1
MRRGDEERRGAGRLVTVGAEAAGEQACRALLPGPGRTSKAPGGDWHGSSKMEGGGGPRWRVEAATIGAVSCVAFRP